MKITKASRKQFVLRNILESSLDRHMLNTKKILWCDFAQMGHLFTTLNLISSIIKPSLRLQSIFSDTKECLRQQLSISSDNNCCFIPHGDHSLCPVRLLALPFINCDPAGALKCQLCHGNSVVSKYQALLSITITHWGHNASHHLVLAWRERRLIQLFWVTAANKEL